MRLRTRSRGGSLHGGRAADTPQTDGRHPSGTALVLLLWLAIQLLALLTAALRVPLSGGYPRPAERLAIDLMLVAQITASAMLLPILLRGWRLWLMVVLTSWPFVQMAGFLSATPWTRVLAAGIYLSVWLTGLAAWNVVLRSRKSRMAGVAIAMLWAWGRCGAGVRPGGVPSAGNGILVESRGHARTRHGWIGPDSSDSAARGTVGVPGQLLCPGMRRGRAPVRSSFP